MPVMIEAERHTQLTEKMATFYLWDNDKMRALSQLTLAPGVAEYEALDCGDGEHYADSTEGGAAPSVFSDKDPQHIICNVCGLELNSRSEQVQHYATRYHKANQYRVLKGLTSLSITDYEAIAGSQESADTSEGYSSYTDDEEDCDEDQTTTTPHRLPRVYFLSAATGHVVSVCRALLLRNRAVAESAASLVSAATGLTGQVMWTIIMQSGGHFAAAVFRGGLAVDHKTFHSYTVRAGQGVSQAAYDNKFAKNACSAGAMLRRANEKAQAKRIQELVESWQDHIKASSLIFLSGSRRSQSIVFSSGNGGIVAPRDTRVRTVPFSTRLPTFAEVVRVHNLLGEVKTHGTEAEFLVSTTTTTAPAKRTHKPRVRSRSNVAPLPPSSSSCTSRDSSIAGDGGSPKRDGGSPKTDGGSPKTDGGSPKRDGGSPKRDGGSPKRDGGSPKRDGGGQAVLKKKKKKKTKPDFTNREVTTFNKKVQENIEELRMLEALRFVEELLHTVCWEGDLDQLTALRSYCADGGTVTLSGWDELVRSSVERYRGNFSLLQLRLGNMNKTALHVATEKQHKEMVRWLLETGDCDLTHSDESGRVPYNCCPNMVLKNVYWTYRIDHPDAHEYTETRIPSPYTAHEIEVIATKKKEKNQRQKARRIALRQEQTERERFLNLSDREKRALAANRRLLGSLPASSEAPRPVLLRCFQCANDMSGQIPYEYSANKFCSTECVKLHRNNNKVNRRGT